MADSNHLRQAIALARAGQRRQARDLLARLVEAEPLNQAAWFWLSDLAESPDDRIRALENALKIDPNYPRAQARLMQLYRQQRRERERRQANRTWQALRGARAAIGQGRRREAKERLLALVREDERSEAAWRLLADLADDLPEEIGALERVVALHPADAGTRSRLARLQDLQERPLALGAMYEEQGRLAQAKAAYLAASLQARSPVERATADRRLEALDRLAEVAGARPIDPTLTLARLALGPPLLYGLLVLVEGGLNPFRVPPILYAAGLGALFGSFLAVGASATPRHPVWKALLGPDGLSEPPARLGAGLAGWLLVLVPYLLLFAMALARLSAYYAGLRPG